MNLSVYGFFVENSMVEEFQGKRVLEVGPGDASVRPFVQRFLRPTEYVGVDAKHGKYVDLIVPAERLAEYFGPESFDVIIATELLEHVIDWRCVINNMKTVLRSKGCVYITTRSLGYPYHYYLCDLWRYELEDMKKILSDFHIMVLKKDYEAPGLFLKARKPLDYKPNDLSEIAIYSVVLGKKTVSIPQPSEISFMRKLKYLIASNLLGVITGRLRQVLLR
jgi:SAM-dependent methyltransferase